MKLQVDDGVIETGGESSYGIYAASKSSSGGSGTTGTGGNVSVETGADITASGKNSAGIYVESQGDSGNGAISVTVDSGGTVTVSGDGSAAIFFDQGDVNTQTNYGTIATSDLSSTSIFALVSENGGVAATNYGIFGGPVDLEEGHGSTFTNSGAGTLNLPASFDLGSDWTLINGAVMSPGGRDTVLTSTVTGSVTQLASGTFLVDLDGTSTDEIVMTNSGTTLEGRVSVNVISATDSSGSSAIATSNAGNIYSDLTVNNPAAASYTVTTGTSSDTITLSWNIHYDDENLLGSASDNQSSVAAHLQQVLEHEEGMLGEELAALLNIVDEDEYIDALDSFASQIASDVQLSQLFSARRFSDALLSCSVRDGVYRFVDQDQCAWLRARGSGMERSSSAANRPFDQSAWQIAGGGQFAIRDDWFLGAGFSFEDQSLSVDDIASAGGQIYQGGLVAKHPGATPSCRRPCRPAMATSTSRDTCSRPISPKAPRRCGRCRASSALPMPSCRATGT